MKNIKKIALSLALGMVSLTSFAQDCEIQIAPYVDDKSSEIPEASKEQLISVLERLATANGVTKDITYAEFLITVKIDILDKHITTTAPPQYVNNLGVNLYIVDAYTGQKYANTYMEVDGVGASEAKSFNNAIKSLRPQNAKIQAFMQSAKQKVIAYYDQKYPTILQDAERKAKLGNYEEALAMVCAIPTCSKGGKAAITAGMKIYKAGINRYAQLQLAKAKKIWAANPTLEGAQEAVALLLDVDPEASNKKEITAFLTSMNKQVRVDIDFWTKGVYNNEVDLEKRRIDAMKEIGKAYGEGQKKTIIVSGGLGSSPIVVGNTK